MASVLLLGAGSDLGQSLANQFASHGYTLWLAGRNLDALGIQAHDLSLRHNVSTAVFYFDAETRLEEDSMLNALPSLPDVAIYLAGYMGNAAPMDAGWADTERILVTNFLGAIFILHPLAIHMKERKTGHLIVISSVAGERGRKSNFMYGASKAGLTAYLSGLRNSLFETGVKVLTVKPGFMRTKMTEGLPLPSLLTAEPDAAAAAIFKAFKNGQDVLYVKPIWKLIMGIIRIIPEGVFKKLSL